MSIQASKSPDLDHQKNKVLCFKNYLINNFKSMPLQNIYINIPIYGLFK